MLGQPAVVVLAAGRGTRFRGDRHKLEQSIGGGPTVLAQTLRHVIESRLPLVVVTSETLAPLAAKSVAARDVTVLDPALPVGMGHSIAAGVAARPHASGWLVLPGDMPMVQPATLLAIAAALADHAVAYPQYRGRRGHPVGFGAELYSELTALDGDEGARRLIARYPSHAVDVDDAGVLVDIDTQQDLHDVAAHMPVAAPATRRGSSHA
jgi:molybdenum cofactor cytidylyltransferase